MTSTIELLTYADLIDHLVDYTGANPSPHKVRQAKRAIRDGYKNLKNDHHWPYFYAVGRVCTVAPYDTGTISYDLTGGPVERLVTLTDGTWPSWAAFGHLIVNSTYYEVAERISDTTLQLDINAAAAADFSASSYQLVRETYTLPSDFVDIDELITPESWHSISYAHPRVVHAMNRHNLSSASTPVLFTISGSADFMGSMMLTFAPPPDTAQPIDFIYQRSGRPLRVERVQGIGSGEKGDSYFNYTSGSSFKSSHVGSVIRVSDSNDTEYPSGREGTNPYSEERVIMSVNAAGDQVEIDQQWLEDHSNARFSISDPVDIEPGVMTGALLRRCELELATISRMPKLREQESSYYNWLERHKEYSQRVMHPRSVGTEGVWARRLAYMPMGDDVD